jgi:dihydroorotate dehydrogenase
MDLFQTIARRGLFLLDAETAHGLSIRALKSGLVPKCNRNHDPRLGQTIAGLDFPNPVGLAAGYDKNGEVPDEILALGFGFTEVGTLTPRPQSGNPKPRIFRLVEERGIINRLGFNNEGHAAALARLNRRRSRPGLMGINIGANKDSADFIADYELGIAAFADLASYFTINISSPNTPGLRNLQASETLKMLLERVFAALERATRQPPVFLKLAPDLGDREITEISKVIATSRLDGVMISNTTLSRSGLVDRPVTREAGGLSGVPLFERSTVMLARFRESLPKSLPLIGIGGIANADNAWDKLEAGASLVQLYSCMVYEGPGIANAICTGLAAKMEAESLTSISQVTARKSAEWAAREIPQ